MKQGRSKKSEREKVLNEEKRLQNFARGCAAGTFEHVREWHTAKLGEPE
jgi:hypothetical protein